jgi:hypothetical protein
MKYLLFYLHEIALKYPRENKYSSSFYDSVQSSMRICMQCTYVHVGGKRTVLYVQ